MGLLDFANTPEGMQGLSLLAAAAPTMEPTNLAGRIAMAGNTYRGLLDNQLRSKYIQSQIDENTSQAELRKQSLAMAQRKMDWQNSLLGPSPTGAAASGPAMPLGAYMPAGDGMGPVLPAPAMSAAPATGLDALSKQYKIPVEALKFDLVNNEGKGIAEMIFKRGTPSMKVNNGYAYDENQVQPGFLPQMSVSQDGKASLVTVDPRTGLPTVSAPNGAYNTFAGYQNIQEGTKANFDPTTVTPQGENPQMTTRGALVQRLGQIDPKVQASRDAARVEILNQEVAKAQNALNVALSAGDQSAAARAQADLASLRRELGGKSASVGIPLQSEEEKLRASEGVKADAKRNEDVAGQAQKSKDTLSNIRQARALLQQGPTSSGIGALVDAGAGLVGKSFKSGDVAAQLDTLSGWMVNNVPRMEGPQSNFDVKNYQTMAALVGDRTKPLSTRLAALDTLESLQSKYAHLNGGGNAVNSGGATGDFGGQGGQAKPNLLNDLPKTAPKGTRARDTATGKIMVFNGLSWTPEK
jgi:hypothetical protein